MKAALITAAASLILLLAGVFLQFGAGWLLICAGCIGFAGALLVEIE